MSQRLVDHVIDFKAEGLLQGVDGDDAIASRVQLIEYLIDGGASLDELKQAVAENRLALLPIELALTGKPQYTGEQVSKLSGLDTKFFLELRSYLGLAVPPPDEAVFTDLDVTTAKTVKHFVDLGMPPDGIREINRVLGFSLSQLAAAVQPVFINSFVREGDTEFDLAKRFAELAGSTTEEFGAVITHVFSMHLKEQNRMVLGGGELVDLPVPGSATDARPVTVCFADLVGFTALGEQIPADQLGAIADRFSEMTTAIVRPPVRLVKTIGDAVMLVSPEPQPLVEAAIALLKATQDEGEQFPQLRVGIALGEALARGGDFYGPPVNLASRIAEAARVNSVLATEAVRDALGDGFLWSEIGRRRLKGIAKPVELYRVRPHGAKRRRAPARDRD